MMRRVSQELRKRGHDGVFFDSDDLPMKEPRDWGTLIELLNEDFDDLLQQPPPRAGLGGRRGCSTASTPRAARSGAAPALGAAGATLRAELVAALEPEAADAARATRTPASPTRSRAARS